MQSKSSVSLDDAGVATYHSLCAYTLSHSDPAFLHQYVVDAHCIQQATVDTKGMELSFALIGLYLAVEKKIGGRQVQRFHMRMARVRKPWPRFALPAAPATITASHVFAAAAGAARDRMILTWAEAVWNSCSPQVQAEVRTLAHSELGSAIGAAPDTPAPYNRS